MNKLESLISELEKYNEAYRAGTPIVSDEYYDLKVEELRTIDPSNSYLTQVEPEPEIKKKQVRHPVPMLSMEKAYTIDDLKAFVSRAEKVIETSFGQKIAVLKYRISPKLDGLAGRDDGIVLSTRGNGDSGYDITDAFDKGVVPVGGRGRGVGEIVMSLDYFNTNLADRFEHPRNVVVGVVMSDEVNDAFKPALKAGAIRFVPYSTLEESALTLTVSKTDLLNGFEDISEYFKSKCDYPMDGVVVEVIHENDSSDIALKKELGSTNHHNRWQIAIKSKGEVKETTVNSITWQVGRTGKITPVLEVEPVKISGATIRRVTAHNAAMAIKNGTGAGSRIALIRSGEVIPKIEYVITPAEPMVPEYCPACGNKTEMDSEGVFLLCNNPLCAARNKSNTLHWFKTIGNIDLFGPKTIEKLLLGGFTSIQNILEMTQDDFMSVGFTEKQASNLVREINKCREMTIDDWRILASVGIENLGRGDSKKILRYHKIEDIFDLKIEDIVRIDGFAQKTATAIVFGLTAMKADLEYLTRNFFTNIARSGETNSNESSVLNGQKFVFTGSMPKSREEMCEITAQYGGVPQSSVNKQTNFLVIGDNVGAAKTNKAKNLGVTIITVQEFFAMIE